MPTAKLVMKTFEAILQRTDDRLNWTIIYVPANVSKVWGVRGQLKVAGEINGFPFRTSLFPTGKGGHMMMVNKRMQTGGKAAPGTKARFSLQPDLAVREMSPPQELLRMFRQSKQLQKFYESFNYSTRREICKWVAEGKHAETRSRRADEMAERLMLTMEGERELPPVLQAALLRNPKARAGWERMTAAQKRSHLMGIFYYKNPESRARRIAKAVEDMVAKSNTGRSE